MILRPTGSVTLTKREGMQGDLPMQAESTEVCAKKEIKLTKLDRQKDKVGLEEIQQNCYNGDESNRPAVLSAVVLEWRYVLFQTARPPALGARWAPSGRRLCLSSPASPAPCFTAPAQGEPSLVQTVE